MSGTPAAKQKLRLGMLALAIGAASWIVAVVVSMHVNDERLTVVLLPLVAPIGSLAGEGPNIGTAEAPLYEGTPVHMLAGLTGIALSMVVYVALAYAWLQWRRKRQGTRAS